MERLPTDSVQVKPRFIAHYSDWLPPVLWAAPGMRPSAPRRIPLPPAGGVPRQAAKGRAGGQGSSPGETSASMTTADLLARIGCADDYGQFRSWIVAQAVRNALQAFHGYWAFDPDNPGSGEGFISDGQMRALNITIRRAVHEALGHADIARDVASQPRRGSCARGSRKRWTSACSSSGRSMTTWSRRARPSWRRPTSVTSTSRTSTAEPASGGWDGRRSGSFGQGRQEVKRGQEAFGRGGLGPRQAVLIGQLGPVIGAGDPRA